MQGNASPLRKLPDAPETAMPAAYESPGDDFRVAHNGIVLELGKLQGSWTEQQYLKITDGCNCLVEFTDGRLEVLPMPTRRHQAILRTLFLALFPFVRDLGGDVFFAPLRLRIREGKFREPDLLLVKDAEDPRSQDDYWRGADLVAEVVSPDDPWRDTRDKRTDYAEAHVPEYWIVDPADETVTVLLLTGDEYAEHGVFRRGDRVPSPSLEGFSVAVSTLFDVD